MEGEERHLLGWRQIAAADDSVAAGKGDEALHEGFQVDLGAIVLLCRFQRILMPLQIQLPPCMHHPE